MTTLLEAAQAAHRVLADPSGLQNEIDAIPKYEGLCVIVFWAEIFRHDPNFIDTSFFAASATDNATFAARLHKFMKE
jgi:hypothetical protein